MTTPDPRPLPDLETTAKPLLLMETVTAVSLGIAVVILVSQCILSFILSPGLAQGVSVA